MMLRLRPPHTGHSKPDGQRQPYGIPTLVLGSVKFVETGPIQAFLELNLYAPSINPSGNRHSFPSCFNEE